VLLVLVRDVVDHADRRGESVCQLC
jgi:hypothetical protein